MKISRNATASFFLVMLVPVLGVIYSFFKIKKDNVRAMIKIISLFIFFFVITIPPFQDLYRRYYDSYAFYNVDTTYATALSGHLDFIFYALSLFFKKNDIPFFYISCIFTSLSVYFTMMALYDLQSNNKNDHFDDKSYRLSYAVLFCFINILIIALGLRFGLAVALILRATTLNLSRNRKSQSYLFFVLSCMTHFSMIFVVAAFIISKFVKIKNYLVIPLSIACAVFGGAILPYILARFNVLGISEYVTTGYVDGNLAESSTNTNALLIASYNYLLIFIFGYLHLTRPTCNSKYVNFINVFYVSTFIVIISFTAFNRYFVGVGTFFLLLRVLSDIPLRGVILKNIIVLLAVFNLTFSNVYVQRRPILLGKMWNGLYTPSFLRLTYNMNDFEAYLKHINSDGDWIGHEIRQ